MSRCFVVADNHTGIPYRNQEYMTKAECEKWISHDMEVNNGLGITTTRDDYEIQDHSKFLGGGF